MFFFGYADYRLRQRAPVTLFIAKYIDFTYERLQDISQTNIPDIYQIGFDMKEQTFVAKTTGGVHESKAENLAMKFFEQVVKREFST